MLIHLVFATHFSTTKKFTDWISFQLDMVFMFRSQLLDMEVSSEQRTYLQINEYTKNSFLVIGDYINDLPDGKTTHAYLFIIKWLGFSSGRSKRS